MAEITGGAKLDAALAKIASGLSKGGSVKIGFLADATYPDGTPVALVAAVQEFGAPSRGIPPRPFFRNMVTAHENEWGSLVADQLKATGYDTNVALGRVGEYIAGELRQSIIDLKEPPLKPATIRRKGFDKPLVDTGHMLNSIGVEVTS